MRQLIAIVVLALGLQACAMVGSDKALFSSADTRGAPVLRPGLWAMPDADCKDFDPAKPVSEWPACANLIKVDAAVISGAQKQDDGSMKTMTLAYILAAGEPRVLQLTAPADKKPDDPNFLYVGVRPTKVDGQGRVVEIQAWLALCEPPDSKALTAPHRIHPLPGLTPTKDGKGCLADKPGPVRDAVKASEGWLKADGNGDVIISIRWVKDGDR